jgi:pfkB family carbohydrate kinase
MAAIVTLTMNPALDIATTTEIVVPAEKLRCSEPRYDPGGGGINVARAVHMLGGDAIAVFPVGGLSGEMLCRLLDGEGVPHAAVPIPASPARASPSSSSGAGNNFGSYCRGQKSICAIRSVASTSWRLMPRAQDTSWPAAACRPACRPGSTPALPAWRGSTSCVSCSTLPVRRLLVLAMAFSCSRRA